jgi:hypothetical protein
LDTKSKHLMAGRHLDCYFIDCGNLNSKVFTGNAKHRQNTQHMFSWLDQYRVIVVVLIDHA